MNIYENQGMAMKTNDDGCDDHDRDDRGNRDDHNDNDSNDTKDSNEMPRTFLGNTRKLTVPIPTRNHPRTNREAPS